MDKAPDSLTQATPAAPAEAGALLRVQAAVLARPDLAQSATALAVELAQLFRCVQVAVALQEARGLVIAGVSLPAGIEARQEAAAGLLAAMHEAVDQLRSVCWPALHGGDGILQAQRQLAGAGAACSIPLVDAGRVVGAVTLQRAGAAFSADEIHRAEDIALLSAPVLELKRRAERPWRQRAHEAAQAWLAAPGRRRLAWAGGVLGALLLLAVPVPWRVTAPARLEGAVQRAVVAATDGFLQQANVRAGDRVRAGQVLAELASQDLELERRRRETELQQHETAYRAAQARYDRTQMVISQSRAAEAQAMLSLAEAQLQRARVVAPFDGVVIKGDLSQNLGAPVQRGEVLMVLAPGDSFRLIVDVDESDIGAVAVGQAGALALSARPDQVLPFKVARIVPVASTADGRNYFEVEGAMEPTALPLRPGLSGVAKLDAGWRPLAGWLLQRPWNWLRVAWWRLAP